MIDYKVILKELDLDDNEINVYLTSLKLGCAKVNEISKISNLIRTTTYGVLKSLLEKGLVSYVKKDDINYYQATEPKELVNILDEKKQKLESIIPDLEKIQKLNPVIHKVELFEGSKGLKTVLNDLINRDNDTIFIYGSYNKFLSFSNTYAMQYYRKRRERNIFAKVILPNDSENIVAAKKDKEHLRETRFVNQKEINSELFIYGNKVAFVSLKEDDFRGIIIEDSEIVELQKILFSSVWNSAKTYNEIKRKR
jgi:sugar-specific transcriptional regulator TrmB